MRRLPTDLPEVILLEPLVLEDDRGFFMETYSRRVLAELGIDCEFVQDNHSRSGRGVLRGFHYQLGQPQAKLVRATVGSVYDVVVDVRRGSPSFGRWVAAELSAANRRLLFAPAGFAHGFLVTSEVAEFQYKCSDYYAPAEERGIRWDDPDLAVPWPLQGPAPVLSNRDQTWPRLGEIPQADLPQGEP